MPDADADLHQSLGILFQLFHMSLPQDGTKAGEAAGSDKNDIVLTGAPIP
jgi:hypothetical protein